MTPSVVALHQSPRRGERDALERATLTAGAGLDGDRHAKPGSRRALLLMEHETLDRLGLAPGRVSEQITVRGVDLHGLAHGNRLQIGETTLELTVLCEPCERMDAIRPGLRQELDGRRGRFVRVIRGGAVAVGDPIEVRPPL